MSGASLVYRHTSIEKQEKLVVHLMLLAGCTACTL